MKILHDASMFEKLSPSLRFSSRGSRYYSSAPAKSLEFAALPERPAWCPLWTCYIYREELRPATHQRRERPRFLAIEHVRSGSVYFNQEGRIYLVEAGDVFIMRPCSFNEFATGPGGSCMKSSLIIEGPLVESMLAGCGLSDVDVIPEFDAKRLEENIDALRELAGGFGEAEMISRITFEIIQSLGRRKISKELPDELQELLAFMAARLDQRLALNDLARRAGRSAPSLIRLFNSCLGMSPVKTMIKMRMREAASLLMKRDDPVKEIAMKVGYDNALNFSTEFRKHYGISPKAYRAGGGLARSSCAGEGTPVNQASES